MIEISLIAIALLLIINIFLSYKAGVGAKADQTLPPLLDSLRSCNKELESALREEVSRSREEMNRGARDTREELAKSLHAFFDTFSNNLAALTQSNEQKLGKLNETLARRLESFQERMESSAKNNRKELAASLKSFQEQFKASVEEFNALQKQKFDQLINRQNDLLQATESRLDKMRSDNSEKLEQMRETVDEKLHKTLEERLGRSFKTVSEQLENVHKGLGEMQMLANGVGDLKRVLVNVKARGTWAEVQLGAILEQILTPEQYAKNVQTKAGSREAVEYAIKLPGPKSDPHSCVWLPIDSKFPQEDYLRIQEAAERGDSEAVQGAVNAFGRTLRNSAKSIRDKYIHPPETTDFAIMFLATEGMYAELYRQTGLVDELQQTYRVVVAGPSTLAALLSSLRMGFRTLAIEQRASDVWKILAAVKTEFKKFGGVLSKVKSQLKTVSNTIEQTEVRTRAMDRKLREVEQLPDNSAAEILRFPLEDGGAREKETGTPPPELP